MLLSLILLIIGSSLVILSVRLFILKRRILSAGISGAIGTTFLFSAALFFLLLMNIQTYVQLTKEIDLVEVNISEITNQGATVKLVIDGRQSNYLIAAEEWRLDAKFIKWKPWFTVLGKEPIVRLETLSGKLNRKSQNEEQIYHLSSEIDQLDGLLSYLIDRFGILDVMYGSSVYMPIREGARFRVSASHSGLIARPINDQGRMALQNWK
ncbi:MAG: hypothetical protein ABW157_00065 [Candidatus Thiodiazotropha sp. LLP2]